MKIVVLAGGTSTERDVSIVSGTGICGALRQKGHQAILVDVFCGQEEVDWEDPFPAEYDVEKAAAYIRGFNLQMAELKKTRKNFFGPNVIDLCKKADFVFLGLHGANGEDGKLQGAFDLMGIPYTGTGYLSSAMAMDKGVTKAMFQMRGVPTPAGKAMKKKDRVETPQELGMDFPVVVKTCCGGSSIGVYIVDNQEDYTKALDGAFTYENEVVVEEFVEGVEYTVAVVDGKAYPVVQIVPVQGFYDYENKYKDGASEHISPARIPDDITKKMQRWAEKACEAVGVTSYARVDQLLDKDNNIYCLEINTLPGMTPNSLIPIEAQAMGMSYDELTQQLIDVSLKKYN